MIFANYGLTEVVYFAAFTFIVLCACSVLVRNQIIFYLCFVLGFFKTGGRCLLSLLWTFVAVFQAGHCTRKYDNKYRDPRISVVLKTMLHMKSLLYLQSVFCSFNSCCLPFYSLSADIFCALMSWSCCLSWPRKCMRWTSM